MSEKALRKRLGNRLVPKYASVWHPVENSVLDGTPDNWFLIDGVGGWVELKHVSDYPKRPVTPIRWKRFTLQQVATIEEFGEGGSPSWVLAQVAADHYLFHWTAARELRAEQPRFWWEQNARAVWKSRVNYGQLAHLLKSKT